MTIASLGPDLLSLHLGSLLGIGAPVVAVIAISWLLGGVAPTARRRWLRKRDLIDLGVRERTASGHRPGGWIHGPAEVAPGEIRSGGRSWRISRVDSESPRVPRGTEVWSVSSAARIYSAVVESGEQIEIAVRADQVDEFFVKLGLTR